MRATFEIPDSLFVDVMNLTGAKKKKDALRIALEDYVRRKRMEALLAAPGTIEIAYVRPEWEALEEKEERLSSQTSTESHPRPSSTPAREAFVAERPKRYR